MFLDAPQWGQVKGMGMDADCGWRTLVHLKGTLRAFGDGVNRRGALASGLQIVLALEL
jgi:hypothetical protein